MGCNCNKYIAILRQLDIHQELIEQNISNPAYWSGRIRRELSKKTLAPIENDAVKQTYNWLVSTIRKGGSLPVTVQLLKELNGRITGDGDFRVKGVKVGKFSNLMHSSRVPHLVEHQINHYSNLEDPTLFDIQKLHVDLLLIHPFSDGNGRTVRMFASALALNLGYKSSLFVAFEQHFDHDPPAYNRLFNELRSSKIDKQCVALKLLRTVYENTKYIAWFRLKYRSLQQQGLNELEISRKLHSMVDKDLFFEQQKRLNYQLQKVLSEEDESLTAPLKTFSAR